jgi:hypothetical protein
MLGLRINKMKQRINLPDGDPQKMPMDYVQWSGEDLAKLKLWINSGAADQNGQRTVP